MEFDYSLVERQRVTSILGAGRMICSDGSIGYESVVLQLGDRAIQIAPNIDTDEVIVSVCANVSAPVPGGKLSNIPELDWCVGEELGWMWEGRNSQGYSDLVAFSFSGIDPTCCFLGMASTIKLKCIKNTCPIV